MKLNYSNSFWHENKDYFNVVYTRIYSRTFVYFVFTNNVNIMSGTFFILAESFGIPKVSLEFHSSRTRTKFDTRCALVVYLMCTIHHHDHSSQVYVVHLKCSPGAQMCKVSFWLHCTLFYLQKYMYVLYNLGKQLGRWTGSFYCISLLKA